VDIVCHLFGPFVDLFSDALVPGLTSAKLFFSITIHKQAKILSSKLFSIDLLSFSKALLQPYLYLMEPSVQR
jgi:hypothetical protein